MKTDDDLFYSTNNKFFVSVKYFVILFGVIINHVIVITTIPTVAARTSSDPSPNFKIDILTTLPQHVLNASLSFSQQDRLALFAYALGAAEQQAARTKKSSDVTEAASTGGDQAAPNPWRMPSKCFRSSSRPLLAAFHLTWPDDFNKFSSSSSFRDHDNQFSLVEQQVLHVASFIRRFRRLQADVKGNGGLLQYPSNTIVVDASLINAVESAVTTMMHSKQSALINTARLCFALPRLLTVLSRQPRINTFSTTKKSLTPTSPPELMPTAEEHLDYDYYNNIPKTNALVQPSATTSTGEDDVEEIILQADNILQRQWIEPPDNTTDAKELVFCPLTVRRRAHATHSRPKSALHVHRQDISNPAAISGARPTPSLDDHGDAFTANQANVELSAYEAVIEMLKDIEFDLPVKQNVVHNGTWTAPYLDCHHLAMSFVVRAAVNWRTSAGQDLWPFLIADVDIGKNLQRMVDPCGSHEHRRRGSTPFDSLNKCPPAISTCVTKRDYSLDGFNDEEDDGNLSVDSAAGTAVSNHRNSTGSKKRHRLHDDSMAVAVKNSLEQRRRHRFFSSSSTAAATDSADKSFNDVLAEYSCICSSSSIAMLPHVAANSPRDKSSSSLATSPPNEYDEDELDNNKAGSLNPHHYRVVSGPAVDQAWFKHIAFNESDEYLALFDGCHFAPIICPLNTLFVKSTTLHSAADNNMALAQNTTQIECISRQRLAELFARVQYEQDQPKSLLWRGLPLGLQSFCLTCSVFLILIVARYRRQKEMKISKWRLLLTMLTGACLLYGNVICEYFMPNERRWLCIVDAWLREIGFVAFYGSIYLQIYWYYTQIQTRSAHLRLQLNERELLKLLAIMLAVAVMYLACWTSLYLQLSRPGTDVGTEAPTTLTWCALPRGDNIAWACELLFALWTLYYAYKVRHVRSAKPFALALVMEVIVSAATMAAVYMLNDVGHAHSNIIFALMFLRCQLTVTVIILLVMVPRGHGSQILYTTLVLLIWSVSNVGGRIAQRGGGGICFWLLQQFFCLIAWCGLTRHMQMWRMHKPDPHLVQVRGSSAQTASATAASTTERQRLSSSTDVVNDRQLHSKNASSGQQRYVHMAGNDMNRLSDGNLMVSGEELASLPISEMDPEDIRAELKRVYTQMQMLRNKAMRKDNPHISKKRGGKRVGGARRFSLQALNLRLHRDSSDANSSSSSNHHAGQLSHLQQLLGPPNALADATASARTPDKSGGDRRNSQEPQQHAMPTLWEEADKEEE